jgi:tRNA dimethylallyltransferase
LARVKHHFIGHLDPSEEISAGTFAEVARREVVRLNALGKTAVAVGGSGLYIRALIDGIFDGPAKDLAIRDRLEAEAASVGSDILHRRLSEIDSTYASSIDPNDLRRIVRGLEVFEITGETLSHLHSKQEQDCFETFQVAIDYPRPELYDRINRRLDGMFEAGFIEEVKDLLAAGYEEHILRLKSLGYREVIGHLRGETSLDEAVETMKMNTRRYAKRQLTWFRADTRIQWLDGNAAESLLFQLEQHLDVTIS